MPPKSKYSQKSKNRRKQTNYNILAADPSPSLPLTPSLYPLADSWTIWYHSAEETDYSINGYIKIGSFSDIINFWNYYNNISWVGINGGSYSNNNLFFLMKNDTLPLWEDKNNIKGGSWCYKIRRDKAEEIWMELCLLLIGNTSKYSQNITGLSISPKMNFSTIKVWFDCIMKNQDYIENIPIIDQSKALFRPWQDVTDNSTK